MTTIINYGSGNVHAIANIHKRLNIPFLLTDRPEELQQAEKLILPGVGAFDETMKCLHNLGIKAILDELVLKKKVPLLGVCVGMQILGDASEEGHLPGFGWIKGSVKKIDASKLASKPHLPHMGWNSISPTRSSSLFEGVDCATGFYFLHSYYFDCDDQADILAMTEYGAPMASAINHENVYGFQFHPEKSHINGIRVFENFANL